MQSMNAWDQRRLHLLLEGTASEGQRPCCLGKPMLYTIVNASGLYQGLLKSKCQIATLGSTCRCCYETTKRFVHCAEQHGV